MRRRITYANVAATLALVFAMSGGAWAAKHYLISSTKQISPKVLKALKGRAGKTGKTGATGPAGLGGPQGPTGKEGAVGKEGKEGKQGPPGPVNLSKLEEVRGEFVETEFFFFFDAAFSSAFCPAGSHAVSGGGGFEEVGKSSFEGTEAINEEGTLVGWSAFAIYPELVGGAEAVVYCAKEGSAVQASPRTAAQKRSLREASIKRFIERYKQRQG